MNIKDKGFNRKLVFIGALTAILFLEFLIYLVNETGFIDEICLSRVIFGILSFYVILMIGNKEYKFNLYQTIIRLVLASTIWTILNWLMLKYYFEMFILPLTGEPPHFKFTLIDYLKYFIPIYSITTTFFVLIIIGCKKIFISIMPAKKIK